MAGQLVWEKLMRYAPIEDIARCEKCAKLFIIAERRVSLFGLRDHHIDAFTMWLAGGGVKSGFTLGRTDELGFGVEEGKTHVHDLQATILHLLGLDHEKLTYRSQGRDFRLTDVHGRVIDEILA